METPHITTFSAYYHYYFDNTHRFDGHRHGSWEINLVRSGELEISYDGTVLTLHPGEMFLGEPYAFHRNAVYARGTTDLAVLMFAATGICTMGEPRLLSLEADGAALVNILIPEMDAQGTQGHYSPEEAPPYRTAMLWDALLVRTLEKPIAPPEQSQGACAVYRQAVRYMRAHISRSLSIGELSAACYVSPTTLKRAFAQYTGRGVMAYFTEMKIEAARRMLPTAASIAQVSESLGFSSPAYFSQTFRRITGNCPRAEQRAAQARLSVKV